MKQTMPTGRRLKCGLIGIASLLCLLLAVACRGNGEDTSTETSPRSDGETTGGGIITLAPPTDETETTDGVLTLGPSDESDRVETQPDSLPGPDSLRADVDYEDLVITAYYATGHVAGTAHADSSFVELCNTADRDIPLDGVALYVSEIGGAFTAYVFPAGDTVPAGGRFLIRGMEANGESRDTLTLTHYDRLFASLSPNARGARLVLAPVGTALPTDQPLAEVAEIFAYVSADPLDAADEDHYVDNLSSDKLIRKKAATDKTDYMTVNLDRTSTATLELIRPQTTQGDVNREVHTACKEVIFSHPSGIYETGFDLTLTAPDGYEIFFSINDTDPRVARSLVYTKPLTLEDTTDMPWGRLTAASGRYMGGNYDPFVSTFPGAYVIKAFAKNTLDGSTTPLATRTYFIGECFSEWGIDLVSLSVDSEDFLGSDGIYNNIIQGVGAVRERAPAYVEFLSSAGEAVYAGWSEIAMNGKGSLGMTQKSFRIMLRSEIMDSPDIGENLSTMNYDLFGEYATQTPDGESVTWFRNILLRNGGGDMSGSTISRSHIGDAYIQRIDRYLAPDVMAYAPVMVFVNGEFWGLYNARERLDEKYFAGKYHIPEEDVSVIECPYPLFYGWNVDYTEGAENYEEAAYFMDLVRFCQHNDMSVAANYQYIADRIDLDGLIDFYCAQIYLNCSDWPSNNIKIWRNTDPNHPTMDTRWHFCIVDTDHGVGLNSSVDTNLWGVINDGPVISRIVNHLLQNAAFRERFRMRYIWCIEVYFAPERLVEELDELVGNITPVMQYQLDRWRCTNGERTDWDKWYSYIDVIRDYVTRRPSVAKAQFMNWCSGLTENGYQTLKQKAIAEWGSTVCTTP